MDDLAERVAAWRLRHAVALARARLGLELVRGVELCRDCPTSFRLFGRDLGRAECLKLNPMCCHARDEGIWREG